MTALPVMLDARQLARLCGRGEATARRWARDGTGPVRALKVGGQWRWNAADVERALGVEVRNDDELRRLLDVLNGVTPPRTWAAQPISDVGRHDKMVEENRR